MISSSFVLKFLALIALGVVCHCNGSYRRQNGHRQLHGVVSDEISNERSNERVGGGVMMPQQQPQPKPPQHPMLNLYATSASIPHFNGGPYRTFTSFGPIPRPQTAPVRQPVQVYPGGGSSYVLDDSQEDNVPLQPTGYTVTYYPTYPPTPSPTPAPVGPYLPAPPGHRPYCAKEGETYCENIDYYPTQLILRLLEYAGEDTLLSEEKINLPKTKPPERYNYTPATYYDYTYTTAYAVPQTLPTGDHSAERTERKKRQAQAEDLCPVDEKFVSAKAALTNEGDWKYVVNVPEVDKKYTQLVRVKRCRTQTCTGICTPPGGSTTACEQQYVMKRLVSLNPSGTKLEQDLFLFPDCCICKIRL